MNGARRRSLLEHALRRHWKLVLLVAVLLGEPLTLAVSAVPAKSYSLTEGYVVAAPSKFDDGPVTANSDRAARDYASILRTDDQVVAALAKAAGVEPSTIRQNLAVGYVPGTGTLTAEYESSQRSEVLDVFSALDALLVVDGVPAAGLGPGQLRPLGLPAVKAKPNPLSPFPGTGVVAALLAGVLAAVLIERLRPQVLDPSQLRQLTGLAVIEVGGPGALDALAFRTLVYGPTGVRIYALPAGHVVDAEAFAARLGDAADALAAHGELPPETQGIGLWVARDLGPTTVTEGLTWLVLLELPARMRHLDRALDALRTAPDVVLVVGALKELAQPSAAVTA